MFCRVAQCIQFHRFRAQTQTPKPHLGVVAEGVRLQRLGLRRLGAKRQPVAQQRAADLVDRRLQRARVAPAALDQQRGGHRVGAEDVGHERGHLLVGLALAQRRAALVL